MTRDGRDLTDKAFVLKSLRYQDRDKILTLFTYQNGKINGMAKNGVSSKRFAGGSDYFTLSDWKWNGQEHRQEERMVFLGGATPTESFEACRADYTKFCLASFVTEVLYWVTLPEKSEPDLFKLYYNSLRGLEDAAILSAAEETQYLILFTSKVLRWSGHNPDLQKCLKCSLPVTPEMRVHLWADRGGFTCEACTASRGRDNLRDGFLSTGDVLVLFLSCQGRSMRDFSQLSRASLQFIDPVSARTFLEFMLHSLQFHLPGCDFSKFKTTALVEALKGIGSKSRSG